MPRLSRRAMLKRAAAAGAASAAPARLLAQTATTREPYSNLTSAEGRTLEAIVARLVPADANGPGALEAGAVRYIDLGLRDALGASRELYAAGLAAVEQMAQATHGKAFADLGPDDQDALLTRIETFAADGGGDATAYPVSPAAFFEVVLQHTLEGTFGDPHYGGNRDFVGWAMLGYPGIRLAVTAEEQALDAHPAPTGISAYDLPMFDADDVEEGA